MATCVDYLTAIVGGVHVVFLFSCIFYVPLTRAPRDSDVEAAHRAAEAWCYTNSSLVPDPVVWCPTLNQAMDAHTDVTKCPPFCALANSNSSNGTFRTILCTSQCTVAWQQLLDVANRTHDYHGRLAITGVFWVSTALVLLFWATTAIVFVWELIYKWKRSFAQVAPSSDAATTAL
jgi:hypothetical protein